MSEFQLKNNRRQSDADEFEDLNSLSIFRRLGLPVLYIGALIAGVVGVACMAIITHYWAGFSEPTCFLYSHTASLMQTFQFGSSLSNCYWVIYGGVTSLVIMIFCGTLYMAKVRARTVVNTWFHVLLVGIIVSTVFMLAVCCTLSDGMRITCISMGINPINAKGSNCADKLDNRAHNRNLPIETSIMVQSATIGLWVSCSLLFFITIFHILSFIRRKRRGG